MEEEEEEGEMMRELRAEGGGGGGETNVAIGAETSQGRSDMSSKYGTQM